MASARTVRAPTPGVSSRSAKSLGPAIGGGRQIAVQPARDHIARRAHRDGGHDQMRQQRLCGSGYRLPLPVAPPAPQLARDPVGSERRREDRAAPRRDGSARRSVRLTISPCAGPVDRGVRRVDEALQTFGQPVIAPRLPALAVHALLHDDPVSVIGDDEAMQIKLEPILDRGAVDLGDQPARSRKRRAVEADPIADRDELMRRLARMLAASAADMDAELSPTAASGRASARR